MANPDELLLATFQLDMSSNQCGYPLCCPGTQPKFMDVEFFPTSLSDMGFEGDLREFMEETEAIYHETGMPMIPCFLHHFCLPFSPLCVLCYCMSRRKSRLEDIVEDFNKEKAKPKGVYVKWNDDYYASYNAQPRRTGRGVVMIQVLKPGLDIKMNIPARQEFCAKNGIQFVNPIIQGQQNPGFPVQNPGFPMQNPGMIPMTQQLPYNNPGILPGGPQNPYPPPPYAPQDVGAGGFYPQPPPPQAGIQPQPYLLPPQHAQPPQYVLQGNTGLMNTGMGHRHHRRTDSKSSYSSSDDEK